jgi:trehalose utilization protein
MTQSIFTKAVVSRREALAGLGATLGATLLASPALAADQRKVVVWSERTAPANMYPNDINGAIAEGLKSLAGWEVVTANIDQPDQGLPDALLKSAEVLMWWGHKRHGEVKKALIDRIEKRVKEEGMGFIALHSSHFAEPYKRLMGTRCTWGEYLADGTSAQVIVKATDHPIAQGVKDFKLPKIERYGEPFAVPTPETVVLDGIYTRPDGKTQPGRMGLCWTIGKGRVFYFTPGHETYDDFFRPEVRQIMRNAVVWAGPKA